MTYSCRDYYEKEPHQYQPNPVYLYLDRDNNLYIETGRLDSVPSDIFNGISLRWPLQEGLTEDHAKQILEDENLVDMIEEIKLLTVVKHGFDGLMRTTNISLIGDDGFEDETEDSLYNNIEELKIKIERYVLDLSIDLVANTDCCSDYYCEYCWGNYAGQSQYILQDLDHASTQATIYESFEDINDAVSYMLENKIEYTHIFDKNKDKIIVSYPKNLELLKDILNKYILKDVGYSSLPVYSDFTWEDIHSGVYSWDDWKKIIVVDNIREYFGIVGISGKEKEEKIITCTDCTLED